MKTAFIKGTDRKYTIFENGTMTVNWKFINGKKSYYKTPKIIRRANDESFVINNEYKSIRKLTYSHLGFYICVTCEKPKKKKRDKSYRCVDCYKAQKNRISKDFAKRHPKRIKMRSINRVAKITDGYIVNNLFQCEMDHKLFPQELLKAKRQQLKLSRELKKQKQNDINSK